LLFTSEGVHVNFNGRLMGDIPDPQFAELMLATFIGAVPPTPRLKRELLGLQD
jgi:Chalcone isomerase-like